MTAIKTLLLATVVCLVQGCLAPRPSQYPCGGNQTITTALKPVAKKHGVPALGGAVITDSGEIWVGVVGTRSVRGGESVTVEDLWHVGSCGKAMTATLAARLVEQGKLNWSTTVAEMFPELAPAFKSDLGKVTLTQLLAHRSGLPRDTGYGRYREPHRNQAYSGIACAFGSVSEQRRQAVQAAGDHPLLFPPGSNYTYSNYGYIIVAAMIDRVTGGSYEEAMRQQLFLPLGMNSAVFESADLVGTDHVPWGHDRRGRVAGTDMVRLANPELLRPAGCIRCTLKDWAKFALQHLRGEAGRSDYLSAETYRKLHTPPQGDEPPRYALGWSVEDGKWAGGRFLTHSGSDLLNFTRIYILPEKGYAVLVCSNQNSGKATEEAAVVLIEMFSRGDLAEKTQ